jgi:transcription antitermination factor NusG
MPNALGSRRDGDLFRIETELAIAGVTHYLPAETCFIRHNRTKEWMRRRFILMPYVFVQDVIDWPRLERICRGMRGPLRIANEPVPIPEREIQRVRDGQLKIDTAHALVHRNRTLTRRRLEELYPAGTEIEIMDGPLATQRAVVLAATGRQAIKAVVQMLGGEVEIEVSVDQIREAAQ